MELINEINIFADSIHANLRVKRGVYEITLVVAERKAFLTKKKLEYTAKFRIDDDNKLLKFTEMLKESGSGLSAGDSSAGFGFKTETYNTRGKQREGTIEEQSNLFGKRYEYHFDFKNIRLQIERLANAAGYQFQYQITSIGL